MTTAPDPGLPGRGRRPRADGRRARRPGGRHRAQPAGVLGPRPAAAAAHGRPDRLLRARARRPAAAGPGDARRGLLAGDDRADPRLGAADRELGHPRPAPGAAGALAARRSRSSPPARSSPPGPACPETPAIVDRLVDLGLVERLGRRRAAGARPGAAHRRAAGGGAGRAAGGADRRPDRGSTSTSREIAADLRADVPAHRLCGPSSTPGPRPSSWSGCGTRWRGSSRRRRRRCWRRSGRRWPPRSREPSRRCSVGSRSE